MRKLYLYVVGAYGRKKDFLVERPQFRREEKAGGGIVLGYPYGKTQQIYCA
jgi:hypothetical protein